MGVHGVHLQKFWNLLYKMGCVLGPTGGNPIKLIPLVHIVRSLNSAKMSKKVHVPSVTSTRREFKVRDIYKVKFSPILPLLFPA